MGIFGSNQSGQARYSGELHNLQLTQSVFGTTVPVIFGTRRIACKMLFYGGFHAVTAPGSGGGKGVFGGKGGDQYDYYADVIIALASGSAAAGCPGVLNIWDQQGKLQNQSGSYSYTVPSGGGTVTPMSAAGSPPIQQDLGVSRTDSYSVIANDYGSGGSRTLSGTQSTPMAKVTGTPGTGQYSFNAFTSSYTFAAGDAGKTVTINYSCVYSLYYFQTTQAAEVPLSSPYQVSTTNQQYFWSDGGVIRVDTGAPLVRGTDYTESAGIYTFSSGLAGVYVYITYTFTSSDSSVTNTSTLNLTFYGGTLGQTPWSYMQSKYPGAAFGYTGICYMGANPMALGQSATLPSYNYEVLGLNIFPGGSLDAHPCDAFRTMLSDAFLGVGFPSANIDTWTSCYAYWAANGYLISVAHDTQTSPSDAFSAIIETGNVGAVWSGGLLKLIPYGDVTCVGNGYTYTPSTTPVATLTWNNLLPPSEKHAGETGSDDPLQVALRAPQDCWNYVQAQWCNRSNDYNNELINEQNDAFINLYGRRIESPQNWDWLSTSAAATWALNLRLKRQCYITRTYKFWLPFWFSYIEPMDIITLPTGENVRITQIEDGADSRLAVEAEQWTYGSGDVTIYPKQGPSSWQPPISTAPPGDALPIVIQNTLPMNSNVPYTISIAAAGSNSNWGGANVYISLDGESYSMLDTVSAPNVIGLLSATLPASIDPDLTDTLSVDLTLSQNGAELVSVTEQLADKLITLCAIVDQDGETSELISYATATLMAANRYNLTYLRRGAYGSYNASHTPGALFVFLGPNFQFASYTFGQSNMGHVLYVKLQSFNLVGKQLQNLANCQVYEYTLGYETGMPGSKYFPSTAALTIYPVSGVSPSNATVTNPDNAFDGIFTSGAVFTSGAPCTPYNSVAGTPQDILNYAGFPSVTLNYASTLYVSYSALAGLAYGGGGYPPMVWGSVMEMQVNLNGTPVAGSWTLIDTPIETYGGGPEIRSGSVAQGTVAISIPAGTNLAQLVVSFSTENTAPPSGVTSSSPDANINIIQIWIQ